MSRSTWMVLLASLLLGVGPTAHANAPKDAKLALAKVNVHQYLPKGSRIVVSVADFKDLITHFKQTPLYALLQEKEIQPLFKKVTDGFLKPQLRYDYRRRKMRKRKSPWQRAQALAKQLTGFTITEAVQIFRGPHALAVVGIPRGSSPLELAGAFGVDDPKQAWKLLHTLLNRVPIRKKAYAYKGVNVKVLLGLENQFHYAIHGHRVLIATTARVMKQMLDNGMGGKQHLNNDAGFRKFMSTVSLQHGARIYVAADTLLKDLAANMGASRASLLGILGLQSWQSIGMATGMQAKRFHTRFHLRFQKGTKLTGINRLLALPAADTSLLKRMPDRTIAAGLARIPWVKLYDDAMDVMKKAQPRQYKRLQRDMGRLERAILRTSVRNIIDSLGENAAVFVYPYAHGGLIPQFTLAAKLKDPSVLQALIQTLAKQLNLKIVKQTYRGVTTLNLRIRRMRYYTIRKLPRNVRAIAYMLMGLGGMQLSYAFVGKELWFSLSPQTLKNFIDRQKNKSNAARDAHIKKLLAEAKGTGAWTYLDIKQAFAPLYSTLLGASPFMGSRTLRRMPLFRGLSFAQLPRTKVIARHLHPSMSSARHEGQDSLFRLRSGLGLEMLAAGGALIPIAGRLFFQFRIQRYIRGMVRFLRLEEASKTYTQKGLYHTAKRRWKRYGRYAMTDAVRLTAMAHVKRFDALAKARQKRIVGALNKRYKKQAVAIQEWNLFGDWEAKGAELHAIADKSNRPSVYFGSQQLSTYILQFEVRNPTKGFFLSLHTQPQIIRRGYGNRYSSYRQARKIFFAKKRFQKDQWVPIKIKVKGQRISYWFGLKHYRTRAYPKRGQIGFKVPFGGQFAMRNLKIEVPKAKKPAAAQKLYPSLQISLTGNTNSVELNDNASFRLTIHNGGQLPAKDLAIRLQLSNHIAYQGIVPKPPVTSLKQRAGNKLILSKINTLEGGQTLRLTINVKGKQAGSALCMAAIKFAQMKGEIAVSARLHVTPSPKKAAMAPSHTKTASTTTRRPMRDIRAIRPTYIARKRPYRKPVKIAAARPRIYGSIPKPAIMRVMRLWNKRFKFCYERQLVRNPKLSGKIVLRFVIASNGRIQRISTNQDTLGNRRVTRCVLRMARRMRFPKPNGGGIVIVKYPLIFRSN